MITDFLHKSGEAEKGFVSNNEWWVICGSVKVQIFLTNLEDDAELVVAANLFKYTEQNKIVNEYVLKLNGTLKLKGASFGIRNKHLILSYVRPVRGLDFEELELMPLLFAAIPLEFCSSWSIFF